MKKEEALKILRELHGKAIFSVRTALETILPELRESEDERIRKRLIEYFSSQPDHYHFLSFTKAEMLVWLEKQKAEKQLPGFEDDPLNDERFLIGFDTGRDVQRIFDEKKPAEWSEEDDKIRRNLMSLLANMRGDRITEETYKKYYPWLKSLPSRFALSSENHRIEEILYFHARAVLDEFGIYKRTEELLGSRDEWLARICAETCERFNLK